MERALAKEAQDAGGSHSASIPREQEAQCAIDASIDKGLRQRLVHDARQLALAARGTSERGAVRRALVGNDSFRILLLQRLRELALDSPWLPGVNHALRVTQMSLFGVEIGKDVTLGAGVYFVHPVGVVIGGDSRVGDRVRFYGNNTVGTAKDNGYPTIEEDVVVGAGARILGPIRIGARSEIGANAVVLTDIPPDSVVVGMPARVVSTTPPRQRVKRAGANHDQGEHHA